MTDDLPELTPAESERVRRLLAGARHTDPVPPDVAARLDRTLASLGAERQERVVVTLASRRRRAVAKLLVAAVAVVAVGVGLGQGISGLSRGADDSSSAGAGGSTADQDGGESLAEEPAAPPSAGSAPQTGGDVEAAGLPRVGDATFDRDVLAARTAPTAARGDGGAYAGAGACDSPGWGTGRRVPVRYAGQPAVLVLRPVDGPEQSVDLFACGSDVPLRSTVVPAP